MAIPPHTDSKAVDPSPEQPPEFLNVRGKDSTHRIAWRHNNGPSKDSAPGLFWLGGFKSDMEGSKARALVRMGEEQGMAVTRFDYSGHGLSEGDVVGGSISDWLAEAEAVFGKTTGLQIIIGSSMGAWLALLLNRRIRARQTSGDTPASVAGLVLLAPAVDMTRDLMADNFSENERRAMETDGQVALPSDYGEPYIITRTFIKDGDGHLLLGATIETGCPVHIIQGGRDKAVPVAHSLKLLGHLTMDPVVFTLVPDADHSLSRPQDLELLNRAILQIPNQ